MSYQQIPGFSKYEADEKGNIRTSKSSKVRPLVRTPSGSYLTLRGDDGKVHRLAAHRLVAMTFVPGFRKDLQVNHKDGDRDNNRADNLEWCTQSQNVRHAYKTGLMRGKLTKEDIESIKRMSKEGASCKAIAKKFGVSSVRIGQVLREVNGIRSALRRLALLSELKLRKNDYKGGWSHLSPTELLNMLKQEVKELEQAIESGDPVSIALEAADVSNYCCMIADNVGGL